ncbi:MAG: hypothetical protein LBO20_07160 [Bifidobacteriaceae bacterium]|nr:hypothetical protein [Bifidobacteriaceae bacterium]
MVRHPQLSRHLLPRLGQA